MSDRLEAMAAFVAVAEARSFASAAKKLGCSNSAVSRLVSGLEDRLGVRLMQRTTRSVRLTEAGARFEARARQVLLDVEEAELSAQAELAQPRGRLVVSASLLFGRMHVAPILSELLESQGEVRAELILSDRFVNLVEDGIDVAVRIGELPDSGLIARRLGETRRLVVASPSYLAVQGEPRLPCDLERHQIVAFSGIAPAQSWRFRDPGSGRSFEQPVEPRLATNGGEAAIAHAVRGGGVTTAFSYQVETLLRSGELVELLRPFSLPAVPIQAVFPSSRLLSGKVRLFLSLAERAAAQWRFEEARGVALSEPDERHG